MHRELMTKLQNALPALQKDLLFNDIAAILVQEEIIMPDEFHVIAAIQTEATRMEVLIEKFAGKPDHVYHKFLKILQKDFSWLADAIKGSDIPDSVPVPPAVNKQEKKCSRLASTKRLKSKYDKNKRLIQRPYVKDLENKKNLKKALTTDMVTLLRKNQRVSRDWTTLAHALGLSQAVNNIRVRVALYSEDWNMCVVYLIQEWQGKDPANANLFNLIKVLRNDGFNDVADDLEAKFGS